VADASSLNGEGTPDAMASFASKGSRKRERGSEINPSHPTLAAEVGTRDHAGFGRRCLRRCGLAVGGTRGVEEAAETAAEREAWNLSAKQAQCLAPERTMKAATAGAATTAWKTPAETLDTGR
jgi:hypothetical protein